MAQRGVSITVSTEAWKSGSRLTGDAAQITASYSNDGASPSVACTNAVSEINLPGPTASGRYSLVLTAAERLANTTRVMFQSSTPAVVLPDVLIVSDRLQGARAVTITVLTPGSVPVAGMSVAIYNSGQTDVVALCVTDASGIARLQGATSLPYLDDGSYKIVCSAPFYSVTNPTDLTVDGAEAVAIEATPVTPSVPAANLCTVYGYAKRSDETVVSGARIVAKLSTQAHVANSTVFSRKEATALSNSSGYWEIVLERGATFNITVTDGATAAMSITVTIPDQASIDIEDLFALA